MAVELKTFLYFIFVPIFLYTNINAEGILILSVLLIIDFITAILREKAVNPQGITSTEMKAGFSSKVVTVLIPFLIVIVGKASGYDLSLLANATIGIFCLAEFYSINGNIIQIREKDKMLSEYDAVTLLLKKIQFIIRTIIDGSIKKIGEIIKQK
jgi:predicted ABC-type exoprotein transport system permease subunit